VIPVLNAKGMRAADQETIRGGVDSETLMENAARALCEEIRGSHPGWKRVTVVCGPGNNGGDGLAAARLLAARGVTTSVFTLRDPASYSGDAATNAERARAAGLTIETLAARGGLARLRSALAGSDAALDALFGTGLSRALTGDARRAVEAVNAAGRPVIAADVPSGLSADDGEVRGPTVRAARTVALAAPKLCHVLPPGSGFCGRLVVADIGISRDALRRRARRLWMSEPSDLAAWLPPRPLDSHKADFGRLAILAGSRGKTGAAVLAARGALRAGAGLVTVFCASTLEPIVVGALPEAMTAGLPEEDGAVSGEAAGSLVRRLRDFDALVMGPGLGISNGTVHCIEAALALDLPLLADADALNAFRGRPSRFARRRAPTVLTPHPGEAGRLLGRSAREVQADRLGAARSLARRSGSVVLLKGARSLIAEPSGEVVVNPTGSPLLATAGSGDVLSGVIGALLAGGLEPRDAAIAGAYLHGAAAESLAVRLGDAGLLAREAADAVPGVRRRLTGVDT